MKNKSLAIAVIIETVLLAGLLLRALYRRKHSRNAVALHLDVFFHHLKIKKGEPKMIKLTTTQKATGILKPVDRLGHAAAVEPGSVKFESSDESVFKIKVDPTHETKVTVIPVGPGVATLKFSADADLEAGDNEVKTIEGFEGVEVKSAEAVGFGVEFAAAVEQDAAAADADTPAADTGEQTQTQQDPPIVNDAGNAPVVADNPGAAVNAATTALDEHAIAKADPGADVRQSPDAGAEVAQSNGPGPGTEAANEQQQ